MASEKDSTYDKIMKSRNKKIDDQNKIINLDGAWAAFGFAIVLFAVGVPVWWKTTTVYRAPLPCEVINELKAYNRQHFLSIRILTDEYGACLQFSNELLVKLNYQSSKYDYHIA